MWNLIRLRRYLVSVLLLCDFGANLNTEFQFLQKVNLFLNNNKAGYNNEQTTYFLTGLAYKARYLLQSESRDLTKSDTLNFVNQDSKTASLATPLHFSLHLHSTDDNFYTLVYTLQNNISNLHVSGGNLIENVSSLSLKREKGKN